MHIDPQAILFVFALYVALTGVVVYDLYEKVNDLEKEVARLNQLDTEGKIIAEIVSRGEGASKKKGPSWGFLTEKDADFIALGGYGVFPCYDEPDEGSESSNENEKKS